MRAKLDEYATCWFWWLIGNRWIGFRLDMLCSAVVATVSLAAVALPERGALRLDATVVGLAVTYSLALSGTFQYMVRQSAMAESYLTGVERLLVQILQQDAVGLHGARADALAPPELLRRRRQPVEGVGLLLHLLVLLALPLRLVGVVARPDR